MLEAVWHFFMLWFFAVVTLFNAVTKQQRAVRKAEADPDIIKGKTKDKGAQHAIWSTPFFTRSSSSRRRRDKRQILATAGHTNVVSNHRSCCEEGSLFGFRFFGVQCAFVSSPLAERERPRWQRCQQQSSRRHDGQRQNPGRRREVSSQEQQQGRR
jgi:hypothetical protein